MGILGEIIIAIISMAASYGISETQMKSSERRASKETWIRGLFQAACDRYGVTINQLDQLLSQWDLSMNKIAEASRGSARLSDATRLYRAYLQAYPENIKKINQIKNEISKEINNLQNKSNEYSSKIEKREDVSAINLLGDMTNSINNVNEQINKVNDNKVTAIDTKSLTSSAEEQKKKEEEEAAESKKKEDNDWWSSFQPQI